MSKLELKPEVKQLMEYLYDDILKDGMKKKSTLTDEKIYKLCREIVRKQEEN